MLWLFVLYAQHYLIRQKTSASVKRRHLEKNPMKRKIIRMIFFSESVLELKVESQI